MQGLAINDFYQITDHFNEALSGLFIMAVPFITGFNPDYSGLDFCDRAGALIVEKLTQCSFENDDDNALATSYLRDFTAG